MRQTCYLLIVFFFFNLVLMEGYSQKLTIKLYNGSENSEQLNTIQKLYFSNDELIIDFKSGAEDFYTLNEIRKLYFDATVSIDDGDGLKAGKLYVYPNPAGDFIIVKEIPDGADYLTIYRMDGLLVLNLRISDNEKKIDIQNLASGLYLINAAGYTSKFIKK